MTSRTTIKSMIACGKCGTDGENMELIQNCPIVYECMSCGDCIEVSCGNIDCLDCVDTYPANKNDCEG